MIRRDAKLSDLEDVSGPSLPPRPKKNARTASRHCCCVALTAWGSARPAQCPRPLYSATAMHRLCRLLARGEIADSAVLSETAICGLLCPVHPGPTGHGLSPGEGLPQPYTQWLAVFVVAARRARKSQFSPKWPIRPF